MEKKHPMKKNEFCHQIKHCRYVPLYGVGLCYLLSSLVLRIVLIAFFAPSAHVPLLQYPVIIGFGICNDLVEALYLLFPLTLYLALAPQRFYNSKVGRAGMVIFLWVIIFAMFYLNAVEFFFFQEFDGRFNLVAVDYLIYPHEVFINIWQSYPVGRVMLFMATIGSLLLLFFWPVIRSSMEAQTKFRSRLPALGLHILFLALSVAAFSTHTLGFFSNRVSNELAINGVSSFFQAFRTNQLDYDQFYRTGDSNTMFVRLKKHLAAEGGQLVSTNPMNIERSFSASEKGLGKLNVVVIVEESLGCQQVDFCGQGLDIDAALSTRKMLVTPFLDEFSHQGLFFNHAYATGTRTVRGLEAISASFPPIPSESIMKRPGGEHVATWGKVMRKNGYHTSFLYGGYGTFDNMNNYFEGNGFAISDRLSIDNPVFTNIWGVSDQDLFRHANAYFDTLSQQGKPFFSIIMSTSNHSPYTFPEGIPAIPPTGGGRNAGVLYADYALRDFFTSARTHSWYKRTVFVIVADHGARVYGEAQIPLASYEIPLLIVAPGRLLPKQIKTPISQIDIAPTVLGLLGFPYKAPFFGRNVLAERNVPSTLLFNHNHDVALFREDKLVVLGLRKSITTYNYKLGTDKFEKTSNNNELTGLAVSYYQCAFELFKKGQYQ